MGNNSKQVLICWNKIVASEFFFFTEIVCSEDTKDIILIVLWNFHSQRWFYK